MGKIKVKRKSTLIDMTAMSDVTVLFAYLLHVDFDVPSERADPGSDTPVGIHSENPDVERSPSARRHQ